MLQKHVFILLSLYFHQLTVSDGIPLQKPSKWSNPNQPSTKHLPSVSAHPYVASGIRKSTTDNNVSLFPSIEKSEPLKIPSSYKKITNVLPSQTKNSAAVKCKTYAHYAPPKIHDSHSDCKPDCRSSNFHFQKPKICPYDKSPNVPIFYNFPPIYNSNQLPSALLCYPMDSKTKHHQLIPTWPGLFIPKSITNSKPSEIKKVFIGSEVNEMCSRNFPLDSSSVKTSLQCLPGLNLLNDSKPEEYTILCSNPVQIAPTNNNNTLFFTYRTVEPSSYNFFSPVVLLNNLATKNISSIRNSNLHRKSTDEHGVSPNTVCKFNLKLLELEILPLLLSFDKLTQNVEELSEINKTSAYSNDINNNFEDSQSSFEVPVTNWDNKLPPKVLTFSTKTNKILNKVLTFSNETSSNSTHTPFEISCQKFLSSGKSPDLKNDPSLNASLTSILPVQALSSEFDSSTSLSNETLPSKIVCATEVITGLLDLIDKCSVANSKSFELLPISSSQPICEVVPECEMDCSNAKNFSAIKFSFEDEIPSCTSADSLSSVTPPITDNWILFDSNITETCSSSDMPSSLNLSLSQPPSTASDSAIRNHSMNFLQKPFEQVGTTNLNPGPLTIVDIICMPTADETVKSSSLSANASFDINEYFYTDTPIFLLLTGFSDENMTIFPDDFFYETINFLQMDHIVQDVPVITTYEYSPSSPVGTSLSNIKVFPSTEVIFLPSIEDCLSGGDIINSDVCSTFLVPSIDFENHSGGVEFASDFTWPYFFFENVLIPDEQIEIVEF